MLNKKSRKCSEFVTKFNILYELNYLYLLLFYRFQSFKGRFSLCGTQKAIMYIDVKFNGPWASVCSAPHTSCSVCTAPHTTQSSTSHTARRLLTWAPRFFGARAEWHKLEADRKQTHRQSVSQSSVSISRFISSASNASWFCTPDWLSQIAKKKGFWMNSLTFSLIKPFDTLLVKNWHTLFWFAYLWSVTNSTFNINKKYLKIWLLHFYL
jgi:hypothetical protein